MYELPEEPKPSTTGKSNDSKDEPRDITIQGDRHQNTAIAGKI